MNPELPQVRPGVEVAPQIPGGVEYFPDGSSRSPEVAPAYEQQPSRVEQAPVPVQAAPPTDYQAAAPQPVAPSLSQAASLSAGAPAIAGDDELMEKEWVDKVKKIIAITKGNPYEQAKAIGALQADYLKKRYNREIGESEDSGLI